MRENFVPHTEQKVTLRDIASLAQLCHARTLAIPDARQLACHLTAQYPELLGRLRFYTRYLELVRREPHAGVRDGLLHLGRRLFAASIGSMRRDLRALEEAQRLNAWLGGQN
jgi:hypothetical protein